MKNSLLLLVLCLTISISCSPCKKFWDYKSKTLDLEGISSKIGKDNINIGEIGVAKIRIESKHAEISDSLKVWDIRQYETCKLINQYPKNSPEKTTAITKLIYNLNKMVEVGIATAKTTTYEIRILYPSDVEYPKLYLDPGLEAVNEDRFSCKLKATNGVHKLIIESKGSQWRLEFNATEKVVSKNRFIKQ